ncbi:MAG: CDGSH iron-sulfur domain-containing protein [archaeon]|jgi:CDGSH-type Zn-finger protein
MDSKESLTKKSSKNITISKNGPYLVSELPLDEAIMVCTDDGSAVGWKKGKVIETQKNYALCRCGQTKTPPFCCGEHNKIDFDGTETASKENFASNVEKTVGKKLTLLDNDSFCNHSGFCTVGEGVWNLVEGAESTKSKEEAVKKTCNCPTGRLVVIDTKTKKEIEPNYKESISLITEPEGQGAIWVKGKVEIKSSDGKAYEKRNRVCLCRCGKSQNKPFCDGTHLE